MQIIRQFKILKILHFGLWAVWLIIVLTENLSKTKNCFDKLLGAYIDYGFFKWFEIIFMVGGGILLFIILSELLKLKYWSYIIFETIFIAIVIVHLTIYFCLG